MTTATEKPKAAAPIPEESPEKGTPEKPAPERVDITRVISGSTSEVSVSELSRKGFKRVKVLHQGIINRLITEAVEKVINDRAKKFTREEKEKVIQESRSHFEALARERLKQERDRISELELANESLLRETEDLRRKLSERDVEVNKLREDPPAPEAGHADRLVAAILEKLPSMAKQGGGVDDLKRSLQEIAGKLERMGGQGVGMGPAGTPVDEKALIESLFRMGGADSAVSNIDKVKVKESKAGGVKETLAKLKALQKGGTDGD